MGRTIDLDATSADSDRVCHGCTCAQVFRTRWIEYLIVSVRYAFAPAPARSRECFRLIKKYLVRSGYRSGFQSFLRIGLEIRESPATCEMSPSPDEFERLDDALAKMKDASWQYQFARQELTLKDLKRETSTTPESIRARLQPIAAHLSAAASEVKSAAETLRETLNF